MVQFVKTIPKDTASALALRASLQSIGCTLTDFLPPSTRKVLMAVVHTPVNELVDPVPEPTELLTLASDLGGGSSEVEEKAEVENDEQS